MSAGVEELAAEVERLAEDFDGAEAEIADAMRNGGASDELREIHHRAARELVEAIGRHNVAAAGDAEQLWRFRDLENRVADAAKTKADRAHEFHDEISPTRFDPRTGERLDRLGVLNQAADEIGARVEFLGVKQVGLQDGRWYLTVRSRITGEPVELKSFTTAQLFESPLSKLATRIREVRGGRFPVPRKGSEAWVKFTDALELAAEIEEHHVTERGTWTGRIARYAADKLDVTGRLIDLHTDRGVEEVLEDTEYGPFRDQEHECLHVNVGGIAGYLALRRISTSEQEIAAALKDLGFARRVFQLRDERGRNRKRTYWVAGDDFDWGSE